MSMPCLTQYPTVAPMPIADVRAMVEKSTSASAPTTTVFAAINVQRPSPIANAMSAAKYHNSLLTSFEFINNTKW